MLAAARPAAARWAVLRNGAMWPAPGPAGLARYDAGAACGCCIGQVALRVTLARLLREASRAGLAWEALIAELGPAAHPQALLELFDAAPFAGRFLVTRRIVALEPVAAARTLAAAASDVVRARLMAQLAFADELLLGPTSAPAEAVAAVRAAAAHVGRIGWLAAPDSGAAP